MADYAYGTNRDKVADPLKAEDRFTGRWIVLASACHDDLGLDDDLPNTVPHLRSQECLVRL